MARKKKNELQTAGLENLQAVAKAVSESLDLDSVLEKTADEIVRFMGVEYLGLFLYQEATDTLELKVHRGLDQEIVGRISRLKVGEGLTGHAAQQRKVVTTDSVVNDPRSLRVLKDEGKQQTGCFIPLLRKNRLYGVLSLAFYQPHPFVQQEMQFLETIGHLIGQAIENASLYEELKRHSCALELRVEEKTRELLKKTEDLNQAYENLQIAQERLVKAGRLAAIGEMGLTFRHEINNPLTAILGEAQLLLMEKNLSEEMIKGLRTIEQMSIRIQEVVKKLSQVREDRTKEFMGDLRVVDFDHSDGGSIKKVEGR